MKEMGNKVKIQECRPITVVITNAVKVQGEGKEHSDEGLNCAVHPSISTGMLK